MKKDDIRSVVSEHNFKSILCSFFIKTYEKCFAIEKLKEEGLITKEGNYIVVNSKQYIQMKEELSGILSDDE